MSRTASMWTFIGMGLTLTALVHYYLWARLVGDLRLPSPWHRTLTVAVALLGLSVPLTFYLGATMANGWRRAVLLPGYTWMGVIFLLLMLLLATDAVRGIGGLVQRLVADVPPVDPERRVTLSRLLAGGILLVTGAATLSGLREGLGRVMVREVRVRLPRLPPELHGTTIVQLTDMHIGPTIGADFVQRVVETANSLDADVIAITGDLVDGSVRRLRELVSPLGELKARFGTYFVTGNHEYYFGAESWCRELGRLGIVVLRNERVSIGKGPASYDLAGIDDYHAARFGHGHGPDLPRALAGRDPERELVLLAHQPRAIFEAERLGVGLQLSGHTHGGQIWPWKYFVRLQQPFVAGLERFGQALVYVSNGTGYWGPPMRIHAPAEVTKIVLESAKA